MEFSFSQLDSHKLFKASTLLWIQYNPNTSHNHHWKYDGTWTKLHSFNSKHFRKKYVNILHFFRLNSVGMLSAIDWLDLSKWSPSSNSMHIQFFRIIRANRHLNRNILFVKYSMHVSRVKQEPWNCQSLSSSSSSSNGNKNWIKPKHWQYVSHSAIGFVLSIDSTHWKIVSKTCTNYQTQKAQNNNTRWEKRKKNEWKNTNRTKALSQWMNKYIYISKGRQTRCHHNSYWISNSIFFVPMHECEQFI